MMIKKQPNSDPNKHGSDDLLLEESKEACLLVEQIKQCCKNSVSGTIKGRWFLLLH